MGNGQKLTRRAAIGSIATGTILLAHQTFGFSSLTANRVSTIATADDGSALLTIDGKDADTTPKFTNKLNTALNLTLTAPNEDSAEFDVGEDGNFVTEANFTLSSGGNETVSMNADIEQINVLVDTSFDSGSIILKRDFEIPQANQIDITPTTAASGGSGKFEFGLANRGSIDAVVDSIRINSTTTDATRVGGGKILEIINSSNTTENERQLLSNPLTIGEPEPLTAFDNNDTVTLAAPEDDEKEGPDIEFEFNKFQRIKDNGKYENIKMSGENVNITIGLEDGSTATFDLQD